MSDVETLRQEVESARRIAQERQEQAREARARLETQRNKLPDENSAQALRQKFAGLQGRQYRQQIAQARGEYNKSISDIDQYQQEISSYQDKINQTQAQIDSYDRYKADYEQARRAAAGTSDPRSLSDQGRDIYLNIQENRDAAVEATMSDIDKQISLSDAERQEVYRELQDNLGRISNNELNARIGTIISPSIRRQVLPEEVVTLKSESIAPMQGPQLQQLEINPNTGRPYGTIAVAPQPRTWGQKANALILKYKQKGQNENNQLAGAVAAVGTTAVSYASLPGQAINVAKSVPGAIVHPVRTFRNTWGFMEQLPTRVSAIGESAGRVLREEPGYATGIVLSEVAAAKGAGAVARKGGSLATQVFTRLDPRYVPLTREGLQVGNTLIKTAGSVDNIALPLRVQARTAGQTIDAVSAQRNLFGMFTRNVPVRKPLPNEPLLSPTTKRMLAKFDAGKLNARQIEQLNKRVMVEAKNKGILERSFFADPYGRLRISRLGILDEQQKAASFSDVLRGDFTLKKNKPQIVLFRNTRVQDLPYNLKEKLAAGIPLNEYEAIQLRNFQLQKSGQFKPIGFLSREPEVTLAPGETIQKVRTAAVSLINNKRVRVIEATVKQQNEMADLMLKSNTLGLSAAEATKLKRLQAKAYGSSSVSNQPYLSPASSFAQIVGLSASPTKYSTKAVSSPLISPAPKASTTSTSPRPSPQSDFSKVTGLSLFDIPKGSPSPKYPAPRGPGPTPNSPNWWGVKVPKYPVPKTPGPGFPYYDGPKPKENYRVVKRGTEGGQMSGRMPYKIVQKGREYIVFVKRFGVDQIIGGYASLTDAKKALQDYVQINLSASGFITDKATGKKQKLDDLWGGMFRPSKKDPFRLVERRNRRLNTRSEVNEIWGFRKNKAPASNNLWGGKLPRLPSRPKARSRPMQNIWGGSRSPKKKKKKEFDWWD